MPQASYITHVRQLLGTYQQVLQDAGYAHAVVSSGSLVFRYEDDQAYPFKAYPLAQQWLPLVVPPEVFVLISQHDKPRLLFPARQDFWHLAPQLPEGDWQAEWRIERHTDPAACLSALRGRTAWLGPSHPLAASVDALEINPGLVRNPLYYARAVKDPWEIECLAAASQLGVQGHLAAQAAFQNGASEADIHQRFLAASQQVASQEPYPGIVGLNEAAATLHYERRCFTPPQTHRTLLIDAGAQVCGYASDITRTITQDRGVFAELLAQIDKLQSALCGQAVAGAWFPDLHAVAQCGIARILLDTGLCRHNVETQLHKQIPQVFFPHGLGHLLGLQVHDVGGHWQDSTGTVQSPPGTAPALRLTRRLLPGMVLTIEPGLYFIPMLLDRMVNTTPDHGCDLALIERLKPFGGIRLEDNLVIGDTVSRNLTREAFERKPIFTS